MEEALVEAVLVQWRTEGGGWPFAGDGPWHLVRRGWEEALNDASAGRTRRAPRVPPSREELARMREVLFAWLPMVPDDLDRRVIVMGVTWLARGEKRVPWRRLADKLGSGLTADAAKMRYRRAVHRLTVALNRGAER